MTAFWITDIATIDITIRKHIILFDIGQSDIPAWPKEGPDWTGSGNGR